MSYRASWKTQAPSTSLNIVTTLQSGDCAVAATISDSGSSSTTWPSGFTQVASLNSTVDGATLQVAIKPNCTGSEGTLNFTSGSSIVGIVTAFSGRDNTTQPDVSAATSNPNAGEASPWDTSAAITPANNGVDLCAFLGSDTTAGATPSTAYSDTGGLTWTTQQDATNGSFHHVGVGTAAQVTAASTTVTGTGTAGGITASPMLVVIALRAAAAASVSPMYYRKLQVFPA